MNKEDRKLTHEMYFIQLKINEALDCLNNATIGIEIVKKLLATKEVKEEG